MASLQRGCRPGRLAVQPLRPRAAVGSAIARSNDHAAAIAAEQRPAPALSGPRRPRSAIITASAAAAGASTGGSATVAGLVGGLVLVGTTNRVLYRMALVPMKEHTFALATFQNVFYCLAYFSLLALRYRAGIVTPAMLRVPGRHRFLLTGACEAIGQVLLMMGAAHLPGALLPLLVPTGLLWTCLFSYLILGNRPTLTQVLGACMVVGGVGVASISPSASAMASHAAASIQPQHVIMCLISFAFPALATITKESIFRASATHLKGQQLDVLVVNSYCSAAQLLFVPLLLPLSATLQGLQLSQLPRMLADGTRCLAGQSTLCGSDCSGAPLLPLAYVSVNILFNVLALTLVRNVGSVTTSLAIACMIPFSVWAFTLPLPLLQPAALGANFLVGTGVLMAGLLLYNSAAVGLVVSRLTGRLKQA